MTGARLDQLRRRLVSCARADPLEGVAVCRGTRADYAALARLHYRAGPPATIDRVLCLVVEASSSPCGGVVGEQVGVLVTSRPTLNGAWRELAWPGRYRTGEPRADAERINDELRCISRVVVDPRWRGLGAGRRLVEASLRDPATVCTEAIAIMGSACPFFEAAGMTAYRSTPTPRDARLVDALAHRGLGPTDLLDASRRHAIRDDPLLARELRAWARRSRSTRRLVGQPIESLLTPAAHTITHRPIAYAFTHAASPHNEEDASDEQTRPGAQSRSIQARSAQAPARSRVP